MSNLVINFLSSLGLCRHRTQLAVSSDKAVQETIRNGWNPKGRGYGILQGPYDNMGFHKRLGYKQFTLLALVFFNVTSLIKLGVYPDPTLRPDQAYADPKYLSWERKDWVPESYNFTISVEDSLMMLKEVTLPSFEFVIEGMKEGVFPTLEEASDLVQRTDGKGIFSNYKIPNAASNRRSVRTTESVVTTTSVASNLVHNLDDLDDDTFDDQAYKSIYELNNSTVDLPICGDLNSIAVVQGIINYYSDITGKCLSQTLGCTDIDPDFNGSDDPEVLLEGNPWARAGWDPSQWPTPWMATYGPVLSGDGSPSFAMLRLQDNECKDKQYLVMNGGFHTMLELHRMRGRMFALGHMDTIWMKWRATDKQRAWVFNPGDPTQVDAELIMYYFALVSLVVLACIDEKKARGDTTGVSAIEAYEFLIDIAKETQIYAQILSEMRTAETLFLMHQAEEESDVDKFVCALKFAAPLFTTNHATKYTFILAKFFQWWECASKADKKIYGKLIMTKKTENGKTIFCDRFVEWMVKDLRGGGLGKFYRRGTDRKLERDAVMLSKRRNFKAALKKELNEKKHSSDGSFANVGGVFCLSLLLFDEVRLWRKRDNSMLSFNAESPSMNPEMIDWCCRGEKRMDSYISFCLGSSPLTEEETVKDAQLLCRIEPTSQARAKRNECNKNRSTSTTVEFVKENYNLKELAQEYKDTKENWIESFSPTPMPYKLGQKRTKAEYATAICHMREGFIADNPQWAATTRQAISDQIEHEEAKINHSIADRLRNMSESPFIHLCVRHTGNLSRNCLLADMLGLGGNNKVQEIREAYSTKYVLSRVNQGDTTQNDTTDADPTDDLATFLSFGL